MKALVIGQGGREHALARALRLSPSVTEVLALPGSDGMASDARCLPGSPSDQKFVLELIQRERIDLVVVGPEVHLCEGLADPLRAAGVAVIGPSGEAAQLEGSKVFSKKFMIDAGLPTARHFVVNSVETTLKAADNFAPPYVLKADGLAAGKGVYIAKTLEELKEAATDLFVRKTLGEAGREALLEEFSPGYEISYLVLTNGSEFEPFVLAQDHKRVRDNDEGPNTGGMGVVAPVVLDPELRARIDREVLQPTMAELKKRKLVYRGVLYVGLMITPQGPSVIEFNVRFGDPEAQVILPLMDGDWGAVFKDLASGHLRKLTWKKESACCVVIAAQGYPEAPVKGTPIRGLDESASKNDSKHYWIHAGTKRDSVKGWVTSGGRVLNAIGLGQDLHEAVRAAYSQVETIGHDGLIFRKDIGAKVLKPS